jgi:hypothetical protein
LAKNKAFVDTTILAEVLLKTGPSHDAAEQALKRYQQTLLPVFAIKEWKRGQLNKYVYIHNQLRRTGSFSETNLALSRLFYRPRSLSTAFEALARATLDLAAFPSASFSDTEMADRFRLAFKSLIYLSWEKRRSVTTDTVMDLECYVETGPRDQANGQIDIQPRDCGGNQECCLAKELRAKKDNLRKLRDAIPVSGRTEDSRRRQALKQQAVHPNSRFERKDCQALGDAVFAFFAPADAEILTTNLKDHLPLAEALGKSAASP